MVDTTLLEKFNLIYKFLSNNSLIFLVILLILAIIIDFMYGNNSKKTKILYIFIIVLMLIYGSFIYYKPLFNILDIYITYLFKITYFPSIIEYMSMIIITIILQIYSALKLDKLSKNINIWVGIFIELLFLINVMAMRNYTINLNSITSIYENDLLLSIFQVSSIVFMLWIIFNLIFYLIKLFIDSRIEMPKLNSDYE